MSTICRREQDLCHLVGLGRFELPTFGPPDRRANQTAPQPVTGLRLAAAAPGTHSRHTYGANYGQRAPAAGPSRSDQRAGSPESQQQGHALDGPPAQVGHGQRQQDPEVPGDPRGGGHRRGRASEWPRFHRLVAERAGTVGAHRAGGQVALAGRTPGHSRQAKSTPVPNPGLAPAFEGPLTRNDPVRSAPVSPLARCADGSDLLSGMFQMGSKKSQIISENIGIKLVIVSPML